MELLHNPFNILGTSIHDSKESILEAAEEKSLLSDDDKEAFSRCCAELINPKKRLLPEVAWFLAEASEVRLPILETLEQEPQKVISQIKDLLPSERFNVLVSGLAAKPSLASKDLSEWIVRTASEYELINVEELVENINNNRLTSGFPPVDCRMIEEALREQRFWCREVVKNVLDSRLPGDLVYIVTMTVDLATDNGEKHASAIIDDLVEAYEVEAQVFFVKETENIERLSALLREYADAKKSDDVLSFLTDKLIEVVENWDTVAQPIQVSAQSRGLLHEPSKKVADLVRLTSIHLFNEHDKLDLAQRLNTMLQKVFAELLQVVEILEKDEMALDDIANNRAQQEEEWRE